MSDDIRGKIFDPYFTTKDPSSGSGLGLAMVYNIITKQHDGHIEVESEQGEGATFHLYLPKAPMSTDEEQSGAVRMLPGSGTILVVDDEELIRETTQRAWKPLATPSWLRQMAGRVWIFILPIRIPSTL